MSKNFDYDYNHIMIVFYLFLLFLTSCWTLSSGLMTNYTTAVPITMNFLNSNIPKAIPVIDKHDYGISPDSIHVTLIPCIINRL